MATRLENAVHYSYISICKYKLVNYRTIFQFLLYSCIWIFDFQVNGASVSSEKPAEEKPSMQEHSPTATGKTSKQQRWLTNRNWIFAVHIVSVFVCLCHRGTWGEQRDCKYPGAAFVFLYVSPSFLNLILSWPFVSISGCSQTCPLTFPLFSVLLVCIRVCVCDCWLGLGRLRPPCWTWLNV